MIRGEEAIRAALKERGTSLAEFEKQSKLVAETAFMFARHDVDLAVAVLFEAMALSMALLLAVALDDKPPGAHIDELSVAFAERMAQILNSVKRADRG